MMEELDDAVMAHRFLFHVVGLPVLSNDQYDLLASTARQRLPIKFKTHCPGSLYAAPDDYTEHQRLIAFRLIS